MSILIVIFSQHRKSVANQVSRVAKDKITNQNKLLLQAKLSPAFSRRNTASRNLLSICYDIFCSMAKSIQIDKIFKENVNWKT